MSTYRVKCPVCQEAMVRICTYHEYQGEYPHGGTVEFVEEVNPLCGCILNDEQIDECVQGEWQDEIDG